MTEPHVNLGNAGRPGDDTYRKVIETIGGHGVCPFCSEHLTTYHKNPILKEGRNWLLTANMYPYNNAKHHFLLIHRAHIANTEDMPVESFAELQELIAWIVKEYKCPGGTLMMRCGDMALTGATVAHIHAHFIVADYDNKDRKPILARVG